MTEKESRQRISQRGETSRKTSISVRFLDKASRWIITIGGIGTIVAISAVLLLLLWVVIPLFMPPSLQQTNEFTSDWQLDSSEYLHLDMDEFQLTAWMLSREGTVYFFRVDDGVLLNVIDPFPGKTVTAASIPHSNNTSVVGFADGSVQPVNFQIQTRFFDEEELPEDYHDMEVGETRNYQKGMIIRIPNGQFRWHTFSYETKDPIELTNATPIVALDHSFPPSKMIVSSLSEDGSLCVNSLEERKNFLTGKISYKTQKTFLPFDNPRVNDLPSRVKISGLGDYVYLIWNNGTAYRFNTRNFDQPILAEKLDFTSEKNVSVTAVDYLIGKTTLMVGDSAGNLNGWFLIESDDTSSADGKTLVKAHQLPPMEATVTSLSASQRSRIVAAGDREGHINLFHVTSNQQLIDMQMETDSPVQFINLATKENGLLAVSSDRMMRWDIELRHPEITLASLFTPVWYEGHNEPTYVWQSSSATDAFEPKYSLMPLIFGTVKATVYSMLIGLPLALLAAIYTSEFMHPKAKTFIKPSIEMMASLPSVVLGFLGALVIAPFVEKLVPAMLVSFITIPLCFLVGAYLWQLLPYRMSLYLQKFRILFIGLIFPLGIVSAVKLGPIVERILFAGDVKAWLDGRIGSGVSGWLLLLTPLCALLIFIMMGLWVNPWIKLKSREWSRTKLVWADSAKFLLACLLSLVSAFILAALLTDLTLDPRGLFIGTYEQRNALIVGFVMGFAVIPIIYTIADDALSSIPEHLRSASLACGATPWQTTIYVTIPTAMSGLFSAMMIGLGRAVGETMIVLMAAGNTPVMDWNIFNGFRTLSANIAVELPEAVRNSTHYRTLFLAALTLFIITFVLNSIAELIRLKFRKKAIEL